MSHTVIRSTKRSSFLDGVSRQAAPESGTSQHSSLLFDPRQTSQIQQGGGLGVDSQVEVQKVTITGGPATRELGKILQPIQPVISPINIPIQRHTSADNLHVAPSHQRSKSGSASYRPLFRGDLFNNPLPPALPSPCRPFSAEKIEQGMVSAFCPGEGTQRSRHSSQPADSRSQAFLSVQTHSMTNPAPQPCEREISPEKENTITKTLQNRIKELEEEAFKKQVDNGKLRKAVDELSFRLKEKEGELRRQRVSRKSCKSSQSQQSAVYKVEEMERKVEEFVKEVEILENSKLEIESEFTAAQYKIKKLNSQLSGALAVQSQLRSELILKSQEIEDLNQFVYKLENELKETAETVKIFEEELSSKVSKVNTFQANTQGQNQRETGLTVSPGPERATNMTKESTFHNPEDLEQLNQKDSQLSELENELSELSSKLQSLEQAFSQQALTLRHREDRIERLEGEVRNAEKQREEGEMARNRLREARKGLEEKDKELVHLATFCKSLQQELLTLRPLSRTLKHQTAQIEELTQDNEELANSLQIISEKYEELNLHQMTKSQQNDDNFPPYEAISARREIDNLAAKNGTLLVQLALAFSEIERLANKCDKLESNKKRGVNYGTTAGNITSTIGKRTENLTSKGVGSLKSSGNHSILRGGPMNLIQSSGSPVGRVLRPKSINR